MSRLQNALLLRIDLVFARGGGLEVNSALIAGETSPWSDIAIDPYPSDHRAVIATVTF